MTLDLTAAEVQFLANILLDRLQDDSKRSVEGFILPGLVRKITYVTITLDQQEVGYLQSIMQELNEIHGSQRSTANEKQPIVPGHRFAPQQTLMMVKSISDKLGAKLTVDTTMHSDLRSPREQESRSLMDPHPEK